jgi:hypothetical protein
MLGSHKQSILMRSAKPPSMNNQETAEAQYQREQVG